MPQKITKWSMSMKDVLGRTYMTEDYYNLSNSSWKNGKLDVVSPHVHTMRRNSQHVSMQTDINPATGEPFAWSAPGFAGPKLFGDPSLRNRARASLIRQAKNREQASLGVTAGTWRQSYRMIGGRFMNMANRLHLAEQYLRASPKRRAYLKRAAKRLGITEAPPSLVLEGFFGWAPLFQDIEDSLAVIGAPIRDGWVAGTARGYVTERKSAIDLPATNPSFMEEYHGLMRARLTAVCHITNQNLWLANRLGLTNYAAIAWDLIPWSFVVGLFGNFQQMLSVLSDNVGVEYLKPSLTWSWRQRFEYQIWTNRKYGASYPKRDWTAGRQALTGRSRTEFSVPLPQLVLRLPDVSGDWKFGLIYSSLCLQKAKNISSLLRL